MRLRLGAVLLAPLPFIVAQDADVTKWFVEAEPTAAVVAELDAPERLYRAAQALEQAGQLQQARELYARSAAALGPEHPLSDDIAVERAIVWEKMKDEAISLP